MIPTFTIVLLGAGAQVEPPAPIPPLPSEPQLAWHAEPYYAFVHFNMNTFTDREWGEGTEDPDLFQPSQLDCRQWVRVFREAGMSGVILTAKHHDGFCLWPSKWSEHTVARSSWREGEGDVVRELADACREAGMRLGLYLSPWDRNHPDYGDSPRYDEVFRGQLEELLTGYGEIFEVWFDGACGEGPNGKRQEYDWPSYVEVVRRCQPGAVIFSDAGPDVRWVGNEAGFAGETNWCLLRRDEFFPGTPRSKELTSGHADGTHWLPAECDVSIRPGWYWHGTENEALKSAQELLAIWDASVGRSASLLLNVPADRRGLIHEVDALRLLEFRRAREAIYGEDLGQTARVSASSVRGNDDHFAATQVLDGDRATYWATDEGVLPAWLELDLAQEQSIDRVLVEEAIQLGQRVRAFAVEALVGKEWKRLATGTTVGARRVLAFAPIRASRIRLVFEDTRGPLAIARVALYCAPPISLRAAVHTFRAPSPGLAWRAYEGARTSLEELGSQAPAAEGVAGAIDLSPRPREEHFALEFSGFLLIPEDGVWTFALASDDGSRLFLHEELSIENDGLHGARVKTADAGLRAGWHPLRVQYFQATGEQSFSLEMARKGSELRPIPREQLGH